MEYSTDRRKEAQNRVYPPNSASETESMSSWIQRQSSSHQAQLAATALLSGLAVAGTIFGVQAIRRKVAIEDLKASIPNVDEKHRANAVRFGIHPVYVCQV